jgi:hypothetical protein
MPVDCYKSSSSSSSSSSLYSSESEKNQPAKNPDGRIPRGGSVNLRGIRDGIEGIGDAIDRLRRRVRGGKRTGERTGKESLRWQFLHSWHLWIHICISDSDKEEIDRSEKAQRSQSGSISSRSSVSVEVSPDTLADERMSYEKNTPFTMISIEVENIN